MTLSPETSTFSTSSEPTSMTTKKDVLDTTEVVSATTVTIADTTEAAVEITSTPVGDASETLTKVSITTPEGDKATETTHVETSPLTPVTSTETATSSSVESQTTSRTFKPPTTTDEIFTLTPTDVSNINETDCKNMKCFNGGSCVLTTEGPKCVCRFDRQDPNCKSLIRIKNAAFAGDSYLSHLIYSDSHRDFDIKPLENVLPINIELKARSRATDGLILLAIAQGLKGGHYTALFLHNGLLQFQFSCGLQTMLLSELEAPINTGHEFTIQVALDFSRNHSHCNASLRINDTLVSNLNF